MKTTSKILCALLVLTMVFAMFTVSASAETTVVQATITDTASNALPEDATTVTYLPGSFEASEKGWKGTAWDGTTVKSVKFSSGACPENAVFWDINKDQNTTVNYVFNGEETASALTNIDENYTKIQLGKTSTVFEHGISPNATANNAELSTVFTNNGSTRFYAVYGANGSQSTLPTINTTVRVYGSTDEAADEATWVLLAEGTINSYKVATFNVDISGYKLLKLTQASSATSGGGRYGSWGNACVYTPAPAGGSTPSGGTTPPKTADSFTMTAVAALVVAATSVTALVVSKKKFF